jgi:hypothetical protein
MINYISYDDDGNILKTGKCREATMYLQGDNVIEGIADDSKHIIVDGQVVDKVVDNSIFIDELRLNRDVLLSETDWTQIPDAPLTDEQKAQYKAYRQALRDLPSKYDTITDIAEVNFPRLEDY